MQQFEQQHLSGINQLTSCACMLLQIIGVEPSGANAMAQSLQRGERIILSRVDAFADGVAVKQVSEALILESTLHVKGWQVGWERTLVTST
jgi:hypothetical protein